VRDSELLILEGGTLFQHGYLPCDGPASRLTHHFARHSQHHMINGQKSFNEADSQVGFGDVQDCIPCIEALVHEYAQVLRNTQLAKDGFQLFRHPDKM